MAAGCVGSVCRTHHQHATSHAAIACRLDLFANTTAHERCMAALAEFSRPPGADAPATAALRRALAGAESPETLRTLAAQQPEWMRGTMGRELRAAARMRLRAPSSRLNPSQVKRKLQLGRICRNCCKRVCHIWTALDASNHICGECG